MRLSISNIAWDISEDDAIARLLQHAGVDAIDVAPAKYFPEPARATTDDIARVRRWWAEYGIEITGMQALLFGTTGLNVFGPAQTREAMLQHLTAVCRIGAGLGATRLAFGSPKNRDRTGLTDQQAIDVAVPFFRRLGDIADSCGVIVCLEPNPACYGANFMTTSAETAQIVELVAHSAIRLLLDTGALETNREDVGAILQEFANIIGHVHASEPNLLPLGDAGANHAKVSKALLQYLPNAVVCVEMLATSVEPHEESIGRALNVASCHYGDQGTGGKT